MGSCPRLICPRLIVVGQGIYRDYLARGMSEETSFSSANGRVVCPFTALLENQGTQKERKQNEETYDCSCDCLRSCCLSGGGSSVELWCEVILFVHPD